MKKLSPVAYRALFFKHVWRFLGNVTKPFELKRPQAIAVSGGMDSMTLLWVAQTLHRQGKIGPVRALFVHHHTRSGQDADAELVESFCRREGISFTCLDAFGLEGERANFELKARKQRRELLKKSLAPGERLWLGHHLDDSYEWHMMQKGRSNNLKSILGIPVRNGPIVRPFLCVTRKQLQRLAEFESIPFRDDPTNMDLRFDRNYIRHKVIAPLRARYPAYLKHYSHLANFTAILLKLNLSGTTTAEMYAYEQGALLIGEHFSEIQIQEVIHNYSNTDRGEIVGPIQRMLRAIDNGKKGPFHFSGGIEAYFSSGALMIYPQGLQNYDKSIADILGHLSDEQLRSMPHYKRVELGHSWKHLLKSSDAMLNLPGLVLVLESESVCKTLNTSVFDPLFPRVSKVCQERNLRFVPFLKCLETWGRKREKLPEKLKLLPLYNLSNLFSSQQ